MKLIDLLVLFDGSMEITIYDLAKDFSWEKDPVLYKGTTEELFDKKELLQELSIEEVLMIGFDNCIYIDTEA